MEDTVTPLDPGRIAADDARELAHWCRELGCDEATLRRAIADVGTHVAAVRQAIAAPAA